MASAETSDLFACTPEQFQEIVADYEKYPEFLSEIKRCRILKTEGAKRLIEYTVSVIKEFRYTLWTMEAPGLISWEFASGDVFKAMKGHWKMQEEGGKCRGSYWVEATFGLFVPGPITKALLNVNLPNMISAYHKRVGELYGR